MKFYIRTCDRHSPPLKIIYAQYRYDNKIDECDEMDCIENATLQSIVIIQ